MLNKSKKSNIQPPLMKAYLSTIIFLFSLIFFNSCQKEFILPEKEEGEIIPEVVEVAPDSAVINFIWIKTHTPQMGARLQIKNDTGAVVLNALDILQNADTVFQFSTNCGMNKNQYLFTIKSPSGAVLDTMNIKFEYEKNLDELIIDRANLKYYIQLSWLHSGQPTN